MVLIKAQLGKDIRRLTADRPSYNILCEDVSNLFNLPKGSFKLTYKDEEGDSVTFSSDLELLEAFQSMKSTDDALRIDVLPTTGITAVAVSKTETKPKEIVITTTQPVSIQSEKPKLIEKEEVNENAPIVWKGIVCNICKANPLVGMRYRCVICEDFDLCSACEVIEGSHPNNHPLLKMKAPVPKKYEKITVVLGETEVDQPEQQVIPPTLPDVDMKIVIDENTDVARQVAELGERVKQKVNQLETRSASFLQEATKVQKRSQNLHRIQQEYLQVQMNKYKEQATELKNESQDVQKKFKEAVQKALDEFKSKKEEQTKREKELENERQRMEREKAEREKQERDRIERERIAKELMEKERKEREEREKAEEKKRIDLLNQEAEKREKERREKERLEKLEKERLEKLEKERREKLEKEKKEKESKERLQRERDEQEKRAAQFQSGVQQLVDMGFKDRELNLALLIKNNGDLLETIKQLLE